MKKLFFLFSVVAVVGLTSCGCDECDGGFLDGQEYCEGGGNAKDAFELACEANGGKVK